MNIVAATSRGLYVEGDPAGLEGIGVTALTCDGDDLYAGTVDGEVLRGSLKGGWSELGGTDGGRINCLAVDGNRVWIGTTRARLFCHDGEDLHEVTELQNVEGRRSWFTPWGGPPDVRSIARSEDRLFVNVHVGGIPTSADSGKSWNSTIEIESDVHQVAFSRGLLVAATAYGLATSDDQGRTWTSTSEGLHADYCRAVAVGAQHLLLSSSTGPGGSRSALYRRRIDGGPFEHLRNGFPEFLDDNIDSHTVAAAGKTFAVGAPDGHVYVSSDSGASWGAVARGLPSISSVVILAD
jgi:hypothetical protein